MPGLISLQYFSIANRPTIPEDPPGCAVSTLDLLHLLLVLFASLQSQTRDYSFLLLSLPVVSNEAG